MSEESHRQRFYEELHRSHELRFPLEDYPEFLSWLHNPREGSGLKLLDIACGKGFFLAEAERRTPRLETFGIAFSSAALELARERLRHSTLREASAYELPFEDSAFDYCVNLGSLEHFDCPSKRIREMHRVLKPAGKAMVIVPNRYYLGNIWRVLAYGEEDEQEQAEYTQFRTVNSWKSMFLAEDLDVLGILPYNGVDHIAWYFKRKNGVLTDNESRWRAALDCFVKPLIPLNVSQCFVFFLRRQPS